MHKTIRATITVVAAIIIIAPAAAIISWGMYTAWSATTWVDAAIVVGFIVYAASIYWLKFHTGQGK